MEALLWLIPAALLLGVGGLVAFLWAMRSGQFEDMDGAAMRILIEDERDVEPDATEPGPGHNKRGSTSRE